MIRQRLLADLSHTHRVLVGVSTIKEPGPGWILLSPPITHHFSPTGLFFFSQQRSASFYLRAATPWPAGRPGGRKSSFRFFRPIFPRMCFTCVFTVGRLKYSALPTSAFE